MPGSSVVDLSTTYGAAFIGLIVSTVLFGLTLAQTFLYFWKYWNKDTKTLRFFIAFITVMDTFHTILVTYSIYWYLVLNFGNLEALAANTWFLNVQGNISGIYSTAVQIYYARQIYLVSKNIIPPLIIVILVTFGNCVAVYITARVMASKQADNRFHSVMWATRFGMAECVVVDVMIAGMMCWALYRKKTGFARSDSIIMTLMAYTLNSGLLTSLLGAAMSICFVVSPYSLVSEAIFFQMGKCYVNSVLAMLNSRDFVRDRSASITNSDDSQDDSYNLTPVRFASPSGSMKPKPGKADAVVVVRRSIASDNARNQFDHDVGHTFEVPELDTSHTTITSQSRSRTSFSSV